MKNQSILIFLCMILVSCEENTKNKSDNEHSGRIMNNVANEIKGEWQVIATENDQSKTNYNVCPIVIFGDSGAVKVIKPSKENQLYHSEISNNMIKFSLISSGSKTEPEDKFFDDQYKIKIEKGPDYLELKLVEPSQKYWYILRK